MVGKFNFSIKIEMEHKTDFNRTIRFPDLKRNCFTPTYSLWRKIMENCIPDNYLFESAGNNTGCKEL